MSTKAVEQVVVHPLVLLSVTDHFFRVAKDSKQKRVVGVLLGESFKGRLDVVNSFALPFEEDLKDPSIYFLDHDYLESMYTMFKKIAAKEKIVGFYSTGPKIRPADLKIDELFRKYTANPLMVIVDIRPETEGIPIQAYMTMEEVKDGKEAARTFTHVPAEIGAYEAEEVRACALRASLLPPPPPCPFAPARTHTQWLRRAPPPLPSHHFPGRCGAPPARHQRPLRLRPWVRHPGEGGGAARLAPGKAHVTRHCLAPPPPCSSPLPL